MLPQVQGMHMSKFLRNTNDNTRRILEIDKPPSWPSVSVSKRGHGAGSTTNGKVGLKAVERRGHGSASQSLDSRDVEKRGHGSATKSVDNSLFEKRGHGAATNGEAYE